MALAHWPAPLTLLVALHAQHLRAPWLPQARGHHQGCPVVYFEQGGKERADKEWEECNAAWEAAKAAGQNEQAAALLA